MDRYFLAYFFSIVSLLTLSSRFFWTLFYLNYSKLKGFSPNFLHFSIYWVSSSLIAYFLFYNPSCFCLCLIFKASNTYFCFLISSTNFVSFDPSSFFYFFSMSFYCFLLTMVKFLISSLISFMYASFFLMLSSIFSKSSAVNLFLVFFFCKFFNSVWLFLSMIFAFSNSFSSCFSNFSSSTLFLWVFYISLAVFFSIASLNSLI